MAADVTELVIVLINHDDQNCGAVKKLQLTPKVYKRQSDGLRMKSRWALLSTEKCKVQKSILLHFVFAICF